RFLLSLFLFLVGGCNVISKQTRADTFKNVALALRPARLSNVEGLFMALFQLFNDFVWRNGEPETASKVVRRPKWKNAQRNSGVDQLGRDFPDGSITAGGHDKVGFFFQRLFPVVFFGRLIDRVMSGVGQRF